MKIIITINIPIIINISTMTLEPEKLKTLLFSDIETDSPCIIYMGIGTHYMNHIDWEYKLNQQLPAFLHDFKINYPSIPIKIILFDKETTIPYIITDKKLFFSESFTQDDIFNNVYKSDFGIQVYTFLLFVNWINNDYDMDGTYDITSLLLHIIKKVNESNYLFFFHEYTGRNPQVLEYEIKKIINYNDSKICIDISRGRDLSCCVNFLEPENYPLIEFKDKMLTWINPKNIPYEQNLEFYTKFIDKEIKISCPYNSEFMFEFFLFKQLMNKNKLIYTFLKNLVYLFRNLYNRESEFTFYEEKTIKKLSLLTFKVYNFQEFYIEILENVAKIKDSNQETHFYFKIKILENLKNILKIIFKSLKTTIKNDDFETLFLMFDTLEDKYKLINIFNDFCYEHNILQ